VTPESMEHRSRPIRRVDLVDETLLLDGDGGRVVRLRGAARAAIEGADTPEARAAIGHLAGLGVLHGAATDATPDVTRRGVLSVSAAAALGVTVMALPTAAAAVSPGGSSTQRTGFVQVGEFRTLDGVAPVATINRSFVHGGLIHLLDAPRDDEAAEAPWRIYILTSSLDAVQAVTVTGIPGGARWNDQSTDFLVVGNVAYIAAIRPPGTTANLDTVVLNLPLVPDEGEVSATVWTVDLATRLAAQDLSARSWTFTDAGGVTRTVSGNALIPRFASEPVATVAWNIRSHIGRLVHDSGTLHHVISYRSQEEFEISYTYDDGGTTRQESVTFDFIKWDHLSVSTANPATRAFTELEIDLNNTGGGTFRDDLVVNHTSTRIAVRAAFAGLVRSGTALLVSRFGTTSLDVLKVPLATPSDWSVVRNVSIPAELTRIRVGESFTGSAAVQITADRLLVPADVRLAADGSDYAAVVGVDLSSATLPVDQYLLIGAPGSNARERPIALDSTYVYVGFRNEAGVFAVARLTRSPLAIDGTAVTGLDDFGSHLGSTMQPTASGVLTAGSSVAPVATFAFVSGS